MNRGQAIQTDGVGKKISSHLNLTKSVTIYEKNPNQWTRKPYKPVLMMAKLQSAKGLWLSRNCAEFTNDMNLAWTGSRKDRDELYRAYPEFRSLAVIPV